MALVFGSCKVRREHNIGGLAGGEGCPAAPGELPDPEAELAYQMVLLEPIESTRTLRGAPQRCFECQRPRMDAALACRRFGPLPAGRLKHGPFCTSGPHADTMHHPNMSPPSLTQGLPAWPATGPPSLERSPRAQTSGSGAVVRILSTYARGQEDLDVFRDCWDGQEHLKWHDALDAVRVACSQAGSSRGGGRAGMHPLHACMQWMHASRIGCRAGIGMPEPQLNHAHPLLRPHAGPRRRDPVWELHPAWHHLAGARARRRRSHPAPGRA